MTDEPMRNINPFGLRLQPDLKMLVEASAKRNKRSINAEIVARLEETFSAEIDSFALAKAKKTGRNLEAIRGLEEAKARIDAAINALTQDSL